MSQSSFNNNGTTRGATPSEKIPSKPELYLRSFLWWLVFIVSTTVLTIPVIVACLVSYKAGFNCIKAWLFVNLKSLEIICNINSEVSGLDDLPDHPAIFLSKHQSTWETIYLPYVIQSPIFVAKRELALIPGFGWCLYMADTILIHRGSGRSAIRQIEEQARERFARGRNLVIFPEGTRRPPGAEAVYKIGGAVVAAKTGVPVIPVAHNAGEFWPRHSFIKWPGTISIVFGKPIVAEGREPDEIQQDVVKWIEERQQEITVVDRFPY